MKTILLSLFLLVFCASCDASTQADAPSQTADVSTRTRLSAQAFEGRLVIGSSMGEERITYSIKGDNVRMEAGGEEPMIALRNIRQPTVRMLMPQEKAWVEMPVRDMSPYAEESDDKVTRTGETRTIHGYECEKWIVSVNDGRTEMWVTKQLGLDFAALFMPMMQSSSWRTGLDGHFPMKVSGDSGDGRMETVWEVLSVEKQRIDDAVFAIPPDYRKMM
ncbi:DUF4412 domain-containing protein [Marilutibacter alkalisoli]|uniref:DUF4412 domain-containing protein n=1 Tax=Marilutibacter alkalisoli TaxID=2591633 RepID=A0A514BUV6_9GAMM|nr:DUF4412 domain-containing protein [Lysobacter alkalisoli]QDH71095.1 DUF4412 domain-containing protein [Lysobacter alkalisoli]